MNTASEATVIASTLQPILSDAFPNALAATEKQCGTLDYNTEKWLYAGWMRHEIRKDLSTKIFPKGWCLGGNPCLNGQILIEGPGTIIRVLKENPALPGGIPAAGRNPARRNAWTYQETLPGLAVPEAEQHYVLLWTHSNPENRSEGISLRLVQLMKPEDYYGQAVQLRLSIPIYDTEIIDLSALTFISDSDDVEFMQTAQIEGEEGNARAN